jgi:hypothetical protein
MRRVCKQVRKRILELGHRSSSLILGWPVFVCLSLTEQEGGDALCFGFAYPAVQGQVGGLLGCGLGVGAVAQTIAEAVMHLERDGVERGLEPGAELDLVGFGGGDQSLFIGDPERVAKEGCAFRAGGRGGRPNSLEKSGYELFEGQFHCNTREDAYQ